jgi:hypothetical protein
MSQVSDTLRRCKGGYAHWCPGCSEMHLLPDGWAFNGNLTAPSFTPSFKHEGLQRIWEDGNWTGGWKRDNNGNTIPYVCHYVLTDGMLNFCTDSTHSLAGQVVALPVLPEGFRDDQFN